MDTRTKKQRSYNMSRIHSTNTKIEITLKKLLNGNYLRYQPKLYGNPDFGSKKYKLVVFIDGCFWHKCPKCYTEPKSNRKFWIAKINGNAKRDRFINKEIKKDYKLLRFWEHQIKKNPKVCADKIIAEIKKRR